MDGCPTKAASISPIIGSEGRIPQGGEHGEVLVGVAQHARRTALPHLFGEVNQFGHRADIKRGTFVSHQDTFLISIV